MTKFKLNQEERACAIRNAQTWLKEHTARAEEAEEARLWQRAERERKAAKECRKELSMLYSGRDIWVTL